jgi:hypothetical protein
MTTRNKLLGAACLVAGGALILWNGWAILESLTHKSGIPLLNLAGCMAGLFGLGGAADCFGEKRPAPKPKETIAKSIWATLAHVEEYGIGEK